MVTTLEQKNVVGRKEHTCGLCVRTIEKGEEHFTQRNVDGRDIWTWRAHLECERLVSAYWKWSGYKSHEIDEWYTIDDAEFRSFLDERDVAAMAAGTTTEEKLAHVRHNNQQAKAERMSKEISEIIRHIGQTVRPPWYVTGAGAQSVGSALPNHSEVDRG